MTDSKPPERPSKPNPAGRVRHDAGGRAVWEWAIDTGRHAIDSTSRLLKRLEMPGLSLEDDVKKKRKDEPPAGPDTPAFGGPREVDPKAGSRQSFNPYDNRSPGRRSGSAGRQAAKPGKRPAPGASPSPKRGFLARLFGRR